MEGGAPSKNSFNDANLFEMVFQVDDIVIDEERESHRLVVSNAACRFQFMHGQTGDDMSQIAIVIRP